MSEKKPFNYTYASPMRKVPSAARSTRGSAPGAPLKPVLKAVLWGLVSCLIFGFGLTCVLEWQLFVPGILCGIVGIAGMASAPALYGRRSKQTIGSDDHGNA